jgi:nucleoside-diphosphate-sugar epimerase
VKILVAGATGAIGRPLVRRLMAAGHQVIGTTRTPARLAELETTGAVGLLLEAGDVQAVTRAMADLRPEVVIHEVSALPKTPTPSALRAGLAETSRLRRETVPLFVRAAAAAGVRRLVVQSIAFATRPEGPSVLDESAPLWMDGPRSISTGAAALTEMERALTSEPRVEGVALRYGFFYGPGTWYARDGAMAQLVRARLYPDVGDGQGRMSFVHIDDAAEVTARAAEGGDPGIYHVSDGDPARHGEWLAEMVRWLDAPRPRHLSPWMARLLMGSSFVHYATTLRGASSAKAQAAFAWAPRSWRQGFAQVMGADAAAGAPLGARP